MRLSITATLTQEEILILATQKGRPAQIHESYQETNDEGVVVDNTRLVDNPQSAENYIVEFYQNMIVKDATRIFAEYRTKELKQQIAQTEEAVKQQVASSISGSIENV